MSSASGTKTQSFTEQVTELVESGAVQLPLLPDLAVRLQQMLADDRSDAKKIAELIENEPAVVAEVLRIANSAVFGGLKEVTGLSMAIARLGLKQVGSIVSALLMKGHFTDKNSPKAKTLKTIWDHSVLTAFGARRLAERLAANADEAFLAGLLHDCGMLLVLKAVDHLESKDPEASVTGPVLDELMDSLHCKLGHSVLSSWKVPPPIPRVALHHEDPVEEDGDPLLICVQSADLVTQKLGFHLKPDTEMFLLQEPAIENLGIGDLELATLMVDIEDELLELRKLF